MNLNNQLMNANQIIFNFNNAANYEVQYINQINSLSLELKTKEKEIEELKIKLSKNSSTKKYVDFNDIIVILFISSE